MRTAREITAFPQARRAEIRGLLSARRVATQEDLRQLLADKGFEVTQATLSRDLAQLGARRVSLPGGGTAYELDLSQKPLAQQALRLYREMVTQVVDTDTLVLVHTRAGAAPAVALDLDRAALPQIAGTLAGDDTIFVAPAKGTPPGRLCRQLITLWMEGSDR